MTNSHFIDINLINSIYLHPYPKVHMISITFSCHVSWRELRRLITILLKKNMIISAERTNYVQSYSLTDDKTIQKIQQKKITLLLQEENKEKTIQCIKWFLKVDQIRYFEVIYQSQ